MFGGLSLCLELWVVELTCSKEKIVGKRRRKGQQRQGVCVYCGTEGPVTDDHVFPGVIFRQPDTEMITVPACDDCNNKKSRGDRDLRNYILMDIGGSQHPDALALTEIMLRESNVRIRNWVRKTIDAAEDLDLVTDEGIIVGKALRFGFNDERILAAHQMVGRGLYYYEIGRLLPPDCPVFAERVPWNRSIQVVQTLHANAPTKISYRGNNTVWWGFNRIAAGEATDTVWQVCYHNWVLFLISTGTAAGHAVERHRKAELHRTSVNELGISLPNHLIVPRDANGNVVIPPQ